MGDQESKYLPITKLIQYWINKNKYMNPSKTTMN